MQLHKQMKDALDALLGGVVDGGPGVAVGLALDGKLAWRRGAGLADIAQGIPVGSDTRMRIGSITKQMTCLAAVLLAEDGALDLDAGVRRYLPELPDLSGVPGGAEPTLRQLMWHAGGQRCYLDAGILADGLAIKPRGAALAMQARQRGGNDTPGASLIYSNGGYHLLSLALERVCGASIGQILHQRLFAPLGMRATSMVPSDLAPPAGMAIHYTGNAEQGFERGIFPTEELLGEGGVVSTVDDMLLWLDELRLQRLGSSRAWRQMLDCPVFANGFMSQYAGGLFIEDYRGRRTFNHAGNVVGGASHLLFLPDDCIGVIVLTNGARIDPIALAERVADIVLGAVDAPARSFAPSTDYAAYLGSYRCPQSNLVCALCDDDGKLALSVYQSSPEPLEMTPDGLALSFSRNSAGHFLIAAPLKGQAAPVQEFVLSDCGRRRRMVRLAPPGAQPLPLDGSYACPELDASAQVTDHRVMHIQGRYGHNRLILTPLADGLYTLRSDDPGLPGGGVLQVRQAGGVVQALEIDMARTRRLVFARRGRNA